MNYYNIDEVVAEAMLVTSNVTDADRLIARQWVGSAMEFLGMSEDEIEVCEIIPKNLLARKPDNCRKLIDIACYDEAGNYIPHVFHAGKKRIYPNTNVLVATTTTNSDGESETRVTYTAVDVSEDRFNIVLGTNASDVYKIKIRYFSYPIDADGLPMIRSDEKQAIIYFIRFCKALKDDENQGKIAQDEMRWMREADRVKASKKMADVTNDKAKTMASILNRMIPNFNRSKF
jgi:hypothetical protein